jgi:peptide/nickel transport system substrate-binding protein
MKHWKIAFVTLALGSAALMVATAQSSAKTLVFAQSGDAINFEPGDREDGNTLQAQQPIYERLLGFKSGTTDIIPSLAKSWRANKTADVWTFNLRSGVKFHDGTSFDADAVKFNVLRWWDPKFEYGYRDKGKLWEPMGDLLSGYKGDATAVIKDVQTVGKTQIKFVLTQPFAAFDAVMASIYFEIASPTAIKKAGADYGTPASVGTIAGTGPYILKDWKPGDRIVYTKNPNYWGKTTGNIDQLVLRTIKDTSARLAELRAGTVDLTVNLNPDDYVAIKADSKLKAVLQPSFNVGYVAFNLGLKPFDNLKVRQAVSQAINKKEIVASFWKGLGETNGSFLPSTFSDFRSPKVKDYVYNPEAAKKLLAEAGFPNGFETDFWYMPVSRAYFPTPKPIAEAIAADLAQIGIKLNLKTEDWGTYLEDRKKNKFPMFLLGWGGDYGDADNFYTPHFGPGAVDDVNYRNQKVFDLLEKAQKLTNRKAKVPIYQQVEEILFNDIVRMPFVHSQPLAATKATVEGFKPSPLGEIPFADISIK